MAAYSRVQYIGAGFPSNKNCGFKSTNQLDWQECSTINILNMYCRDLFYGI